MNVEKQAKKLFKSAKSNLSKAKRTYVCRSLKDLIKAYRACTTRSEERALVKKEAAHIRDLFREGDKTFRRRNISKLLFFHMNGYPTDFGMTECIKLCASHQYSDKRVAYLGLMILVDETEEILMLMTNCLKQDLNSAEVQIVSLALNVLGDIANVEMVRDLIPEIEKHLHSTNPYIRKKAALAAVRAVRKLGPEETPNVLRAVPMIFDMKSAAVHVSGVALISALCKQSSDNIPELRVRMTPVLVNILREHLHAKKGQSVMGSNPDTVIGSVRNPFLQVKLISAIRQLVETGGPGPLLEDASDVLAQIASNTDSSKIAGCAVLYECIRTIISLNTEKPLRELAVVILGRFLSHKDATVRYIALQELTRVVDADGPQAVVNIDQAKVLSGLTEADSSVRKRALELAYRIANENTVEDIAAQVLKYIKKSKLASDIEDGCYKLFLLSDRYGPSDEWKVEIFVYALSIADTLMPEQLITSFIAMVTARPNVHVHAARTLYIEALQTKKDTHSAGPDNLLESPKHLPTKKEDNEGDKKDPRRRCPRLERVAVYMLGEYGASALKAGLSVPEILDAFEAVLDNSEVVDEPWMQQAGVDTNAENELLREVALTALVKFTCRALSDSTGSVANNGGIHALPSSSGDGNSDLNAILGLPAPPKKTPTDDSGLGTDLLASLGLGDSKPSLALVPASADSTITNQSDSMALISSEDDLDATANPILVRVKRILQARSKSRDLETQQRANEYLSLLKEENLSLFANAMAPTPCLDFESIQRRARQREAMHTITAAKTGGGDALLLDLLDDNSNGEFGPRALPAPPGGELLALPPSNPAPAGDFNLDDILGSSSTNHASGSGISKPTGDISLTDIGLGLEPMSPKDSPQTEAQTDNPCIHSSTILDTDALSIQAQFFRDHPSNPSETRSELIFTNKATVSMHSFVFLLSVPKYIQLQMQPASSSEIPAGGSASQSVNLINSLHGQRPIQLRYRVNYSFQGSNEVVQHQGVAKDLETL